MSQVKVRNVERTEVEKVIQVLTLAFAADPTIRWLYPDAGSYLEHFMNRVFPPTWNPRIRQTCRSTNATGSRSWARYEAATPRPSSRCTARLAEEAPP